MKTYPMSTDKETTVSVENGFNLEWSPTLKCPKITNIVTYA